MAQWPWKTKAKWSFFIHFWVESSCWEKSIHNKTRYRIKTIHCAQSRSSSTLSLNIVLLCILDYNFYGSVARNDQSKVVVFHSFLSWVTLLPEELSELKSFVMQNPSFFGRWPSSSSSSKFTKMAEMECPCAM